MQVNIKILRFAGCFFSLKFGSSCDLALASSLYDSVISSHVIAESFIIIANCFLFSQLNLAGFQATFSPYEVFYTHINIYCYSFIGLNYIFFHQIYITICMIYALLMFLIPLFRLSCWTRLGLSLLFYSENIFY